MVVIRSMWLVYNLAKFLHLNQLQEASETRTVDQKILTLLLNCLHGSSNEQDARNTLRLAHWLLNRDITQYATELLAESRSPAMWDLASMTEPSVLEATLYSIQPMGNIMCDTRHR